MVSPVSSASPSKASVSRKWRDLLALIPGYDCFATAAPGEWFDEQTAQEKIDFIHECLVFIEGDVAGQPFQLQPWQQAITGALFGWKREDGTRRYREAFVYVPRKNGKTPWSAAILIAVAFTDGEQGAQIYSAAAEKEQAALIYRHASQMIMREPELERHCRIYRAYKSFEIQESGTVYKALTADAETKHGFNTHVAIIDELHAHPKRDLTDVLTTSTASRSQPLIIFTTTADFDRPSICNEKYQTASRVRDGLIRDSAFLPVIYEAKREDDWKSPKVWAKANPNLGVSLRMEYMERECKRAQETPSYENTFKRLHLNVRTEQDVRWMQMEHWDACNDMGPISDGDECWAGLDLASTVDIAACVLVFPSGGVYRVLPVFWVPQENAHKREQRDRVPYLTWARQGLIEMTPGNWIDYGYIRKQIVELSRKYNIREIAYDPWNAKQLAQEFQEKDGLPMVEFRQGFQSMNEPAKSLERLVLAKQLQHGGNPVLRWMAANVTVKEDENGNIKPDKKKSTEKIDGIVALVMALGRAMIAPEATRSIFETTDEVWL